MILYIYISLFLVTFVNTMVYKKQIKVQEYIITKQLYIIFTTGERVTFFSHEGQTFLFINQIKVHSYEGFFLSESSNHPNFRIL